MLPFFLPLLLLDLVNAYSWNFASDPTQCGDLTVRVSGDDGKPPYRILIVPFGPSPFSNNIEVRTIQDKTFDDAATQLTFQLPFPENSQFVAVVSDANGFGTGGTSVAAIVQTSDQISCFNASISVQPDFFYSIEPSNQIVQCQSTRIWWDNLTVEGTPNFLGVIPGGQSFTIPQSNLSDVPSQGTGFDWTPNLRGGTTLLLIGGDNRGNGTAGSSLFTVGGGTSNDNSCLNDQSPSSTPGTPAGGSYATSTSGAGTGGDTEDSSDGDDSSDNSGSNTGAIVGGVVAGVVSMLAVLLLLLFLRRRQRLRKQKGEKPVDLLLDDEGDERGPRTAELPQYYEPEPFIVPDPTVASDSGRGSHDGRPISQVLSDGTSPDSSQGGRKGPMRALRPVNVIQHDDAGPSEALVQHEEPETVELPPAYTNIRK